MRFIRKEQIITTIFNKDIDDKEIMNLIFENLYSHSIEFSITLRKYDSNNGDSFSVSYEKAKVIKLHKNKSSFDMIVFKRGVKTKIRDVSFDEVVEVMAMTCKHNILDKDDALTRWEILDL
jgi:hypothetical protein